MAGSKVQRIGDKEDYKMLVTEGSVFRVAIIDGMLKCPLCEAIFSTPRDLEYHIAAYHVYTLSRKNK
ncbi:hypothetical protein APE_1956a.1 [Aeropyrum pernix K1]|uniref:C2H2-type domain-containing protein n=1 Tax=Aeropyrum pernix (strain ATCC 700893 / DSM 11879 / JCM 9820 / NBRC 100138 / K1) TaxID=272557 RepID=Q9YAI2_AERPE|nr:hypothetical protein [Aeropyrum pernix]BAA80967.2 hypothetical protein APE_1956a.1 [Aeropyrum pernix K1]